MCPVVLRLTMNMYINQSIQVKWNSIVSSNCYISNGVKQGGCISPTLFSVYLNGLIEKLKRNNIGCRYGSEFLGVFCYADDLSLLCPSFTGIKEMLRTCEIYADEHKILFNAKKSQLLHFTMVWYGMVIFYLTYGNRCNLKKTHTVQRIYVRRLHIEYTTRVFASM